MVCKFHFYLTKKPSLFQEGFGLHKISFLPHTIAFHLQQVIIVEIGIAVGVS